ncbi:MULTISPECIES: type VI secretion system baseplate subunit TssG [unclassified Cedecea]|uniref:type VI secretion system baseplate subunit TssG n=1 Tax=unclassified Cedecea TaxID=2649846 RepID=UPI00301A4E63
MAMIPVISKFNWYQQIRLLLRKLRKGNIPDEKLLDEKLRITSTLSMDAPDGQVEALSQASHDAPIAVSTWINGLTGAMGALPTAYTEWMIERQYRYSDLSAKTFIDLFGHRLYCLDYLAWQKHHLCAQAESQEEKPLQLALLSLTGLLAEANAQALTMHASLFSSPVRSMVNLERWLSQRFGVEASIVPFTGGWREVKKEERCQLNNPTQTLSTAPMIGSARLEVHSHFDVILGPMSPEVSRQFASSGQAREAVWSCIRDYVGPVVDFSVSLVISSANLAPRGLGMSALGLDLCVGQNNESHLHLVRLPAPVLSSGCTSC